jgi:cell filamentation protein
LPALQNPINYRLTSSQCQITYDGNGRLARLLTLLMALQAGLPPLDFSPLAGRGKRAYIAGIHAAMNREYEALTAAFARVIERSMRRAASNG